MSKPKEDLIEIWSVCEHDGEPRTGWTCFPRKEDIVEIKLPDYKPISPLDGYSMYALDTDPFENLALLEANAKARGIEIVSIIKRQFTPERSGFLVITYTPAKG